MHGELISMLPIFRAQASINSNIKLMRVLMGKTLDGEIVYLILIQDIWAK